MRHLRSRRPALVVGAIVFLACATPSAPVGAQVTSDDPAQDIAAELLAEGRVVDPDWQGTLDSEVIAAIDRANDASIAVVLVEDATDATTLAPDIATALFVDGGAEFTVLVSSDLSVAAESESMSDAEIEAGLDRFVAGYDSGGIAAALDGFTSAATGEPDPSGAAASTPADTESTSNPSSGGGGVPWLALVVLAVVGFFGFRFLAGRRRRAKAEQALIETDRAEISEQLRANADRVIDLGDRVIASRDAELIELYETASRTYQEVSLGLADATTATEIDALDDRIDTAEWQLEVIAARLDGRPVPASPEERERAAQPPPPVAPGPQPSDLPALGPDDSVFGGSNRPSRRSSGGSGLGGLGGLGSILGQILIGGMSQPRSASRRSQQRGVSMPTSRRRSAGPSSLPGPLSPRRAGGSRSLGGRRGSGSRRL